MPQFRIGGYRIDFVLPAPDGRRLAVECDGDAYHGPDEWAGDMRRQAILAAPDNGAPDRMAPDRMAPAQGAPAQAATPSPVAVFTVEQQQVIARLLAEGRPVTIRPDGSVVDPSES